MPKFGAVRIYPVRFLAVWLALTALSDWCYRSLNPFLSSPDRLDRDIVALSASVWLGVLVLLAENCSWVRRFLVKN